MQLSVKELFKSFSAIHVVVVGDVMIDQYQWGSVEKISPEAPVPVVAINQESSRLGGAANVAVNCKALGAKVTLAAVVGKDSHGKLLRDLLQQEGINHDLIVSSNDRITTTKTRIISRNQQMIRLDKETTDEIAQADEHVFIDKVLRFLQIEKPQVLIFEDYNKGVLKANVIQQIMQHCKHLGIYVAVDPKKTNFFAYRGATLFKPNLKEVVEALNLAKTPQTHEELLDIHKQLFRELAHAISLITLSERGVFYVSENEGKIIPSHFRNIADVSGAGDTVIAVAALVYAITQNVDYAAQLANLAGGLVCEHVGVVPIDKQQLLYEAEKQLINQSI